MFAIGSMQAAVLHVPGHTPADLAYVIGSTVFPGDTIFMPDFGTARADFPGGDAGELYRSIRSDERREGKECVSKCRSRGSQFPYKKTKYKIINSFDFNT